MRNSDHPAQMRRLAVLLVVVVAVTTAGIFWRPSALGIFFGCGLVCVVGIVAAMVAMHLKRKFDAESEMFLSAGADRDA